LRRFPPARAAADRAGLQPQRFLETSRRQQIRILQNDRSGAVGDDRPFAEDQRPRAEIEDQVEVVRGDDQGLGQHLHGLGLEAEVTLRGIDYALFIVTRFREQLHLGHTVEESVAISLDTSGRAVTFAGLTVVISLLGMLLMGVSFIQGLGIGAATVVAVTMVASLTLLPAMLGFAGAANAQVVISQFYGGGGATSGSPTYNQDFIELHNKGQCPVVVPAGG